LIAPELFPNDWVLGFNWVIEALNHDHQHIANEMEIAKANMYLKHRNFDKAVEILKSFEKKDQVSFRIINYLHETFEIFPIHELYIIYVCI
jgi:hypothetical protein